MCQYSAQDGFANDWHLMHLGARAVYGVGLIMVEATAVEPRGRITPFDLGLWDDAHVEPLSRIVSFLRRNGSTPGIQLAHAGRKASTKRPWEGREVLQPGEGGWIPVAPSPIPFQEGYREVRALASEEVEGVINSFVGAAQRAVAAGFQVIELHAAHGYLIHSFLSPLTNKRDDHYGGSFDNRVRLLVSLAERVRGAVGNNIVLAVRLSCMDWIQGGWSLPDSIELSFRLGRVGVDLIDCSSGGLIPSATIPLHEGYQVPFAERIKETTGISTAAVGLITRPEFAESILRENKADMVLLGRELLRDPAWLVRAATTLKTDMPDVASQYHRMF